MVVEADGAAPPTVQTTAPRATKQWRRPAFAVSLAAALLIGGITAVEAWRSFTAPGHPADVDESRASVILLPFEIEANVGDLRV